MVPATRRWRDDNPASGIREGCAGAQSWWAACPGPVGLNVLAHNDRVSPRTSLTRSTRRIFETTMIRRATETGNPDSVNLASAYLARSDHRPAMEQRQALRSPLATTQAPWGRHGPGSVLHLNACPRFRYGGHVRDRVADGAGSLRAERGRWRSSRRTGRELDGAVTGRPSLPRVRCSCESARAGLRVGGAGGGRCGIPVSGWSLASTPAAP
jgi:hypothetical protein